MKVSIIIPIFNEEELLPEVMRRVRKLPLDMELILVDDCSTDGTARILAEEAKHPGTRVCTHKGNRGKGAAIRTGLAFATGHAVVIQDADLEYHPDQIPALIEPIEQGRARVVFGSRFKGQIQKMKLPNRVANHILAWFVSLYYGHRISDEATAYKAFTRDLLLKFDLQCERFEFCPEVTAKAIRCGEKIYEIPITYYARTFEEGKKIGYRDFAEAIYTLFRYRFWKPRK